MFLNWHHSATPKAITFSPVHQGPIRIIELQNFLSHCLSVIHSQSVEWLKIGFIYSVGRWWGRLSKVSISRRMYLDEHQIVRYCWAIISACVNVEAGTTTGVLANHLLPLSWLPLISNKGDSTNLSITLFDFCISLSEKQLYTACHSAYFMNNENRKI